MNFKIINIVLVVILGVFVGVSITDNNRTDSTSVASSSSQKQDTKKTGFKFSASSMKKSLADSGYQVRTDHLKTLNSHVAEYKSEKMSVMFDIYHNYDNSIEWVEIIVDASGYINLNKPDAPPDERVVEATTKWASQAYKFPFYPNDSEDMKKLSEWVDSNVGKAIKQGIVIETKIGDLYYTMYGQPYMRFLEISSTPKK